MYNLPALYSSAAPDSVLWLAVRAIAFADMRNESVQNGIPFYIKARQSYGAALSGIRTIIQDQRAVANDNALAAILLIDGFEVRISKPYWIIMLIASNR